MHRGTLVIQEICENKLSSLFVDSDSVGLAWELKNLYFVNVWSTDYTLKSTVPQKENKIRDKL